MKKTILLGDKIKANKGSWTFDSKKIVKNFDKHISKSVPFHNKVHELISQISVHFLSDNSNLLDIGCSTGSLLSNICKKNVKKKIKYIGIDESKEMINFAKKKFKKKNIKFYNQSVKQFKFNKYDFILSIYTMQFIKPKERQLIYNKIYKNLNWGAAFLLFEKIRGPDARFQDMYNNIYYEYKLVNGYKPSEIFNKNRSLAGVLEPFSDKGNLKLLKTAGFKDIATIFHWVNFKGYLCIK
tara:strand:- start:82 stop:801 length:720 start_codon:yes stop_codon:yes gene_type:complete